MHPVTKLLVSSGTPAETPDDDATTPAQTLHLAAAILTGLVLALRGWTLGGSWYYADDHRLLSQAREQGLSLSYLGTPFDSQYMPVGRLVAWLVAGGADSSPSWALTVAITLLLLAGAAAACWWMLVVCFGPRWEILLLQVIFLTSTLALPATMWWAASLNQIPLLVAWCGCVAAGVLHLRTGRWRWLAVLATFLVLGLLAYIKTLLVVPVLAFIALGYFSSGTLGERVRHTALRWRWALAGIGAMCISFTLYYRYAIPQPFSELSASAVAGPVADRLIGTSWATASLGGPWRWDDGNAPIGITAPWDWSVHLSWILIAFLIAYAWLRRDRTGRAWGLLALCLALDYALLLSTRAPFFGAVSGNEMRYLTEAAAAGVLCLGLAFLPLVGATESSAPREQPLLRGALSPLVACVACGAVVASSLYSTATYVRIWHTDNQGQKFLDNLADGVLSQGQVHLVDAQVPEDVMPPLTLPYNRLSALTPLYARGASYPDVTGDLLTVTTEGRLATTVIEPGMVAGAGPTPDCGWKITSSGRTIDLPAKTLDVTWWVRIAYLSSSAGPVRIGTGSETRLGQLSAGLGSLYVRFDGGFDSVTLSGLAPDTTLCVDAVEVGTPAAGSPVT